MIFAAARTLIAPARLCRQPVALLSTSASAQALRTLYVTNVPYKATHDELREVFSKIGWIASLRIPRFHQSTEGNAGRGIAFITMDEEICQKAIEASNEPSGLSVGGRRLFVKLSDKEVVPSKELSQKRRDTLLDLKGIKRRSRGSGDAPVESADV